MVRFSRVRLAAVPMCHPQVIKSRQWRRHDGGNTLQYQGPYEGLKALPLKAMECDKLSDPRLVPQPANPHVGRLSMSGATPYHEIGWNVEYTPLGGHAESRIMPSWTN